MGASYCPSAATQAELTTSGIGVSAWLGGEYQYPLGESGTGPRASLWRLRAGGNLSRKEYRESRFDQMTLSGHVGPRWLIGRTSEASLLLSGLHHWTGSGIEEPSHHDIGFRFEGRHRIEPADDVERAAIVAPSQIRRTRGSRRAEHRCLGRRGLAGVGDDAHRRGRIGWGRERTEMERWRNSRRWVRLGATAVLPWGFTVGGSGTLRWTAYEGNWAPFVPSAARSAAT